MRAVVARGRSLKVEDVADPIPGPGEVLVRVIACGICGSDLHALQYAPHGEEPGFGPLAAAEGRPVVMGHEFVAELLEYGPDTKRELAIGSAVTSMPVIAREGARQSLAYGEELPGGYAERMVLSEALLLPVPAGMEVERAALTEPMAVGIHAVARSSVTAEDVPLVIGCGPVGLAVIAALRLRGHERIVAADYSPKRRIVAQALGASTVVDPRETPAVEAWLAEVGDERPAMAYECVGVPGMLALLIGELPRHSRILVAGVCMEPDTIHPLAAIGKEVNLQFVLGYTPEEFAEALGAIAEGRIDVAPLITGRVGLDETPAAFTSLGQPDEHVKILVVPGLG